MLLQLQEYIQSFLRVEIDMRQDKHRNANSVATLHFHVTNAAPSYEYSPNITYEEVQLKVGVSPNWIVERVANFGPGQTFTYDHPCTNGEVTRLQWSIEGKISPETLLTFHRRPVNVYGNGQLSVKAYFDYLNNMKVFEKLEDILKTVRAPAADATLCEAKAEESLLKGIADDLGVSAQGIHDLMEFLDLQENYEEINKHKNMVRGQLKKTEGEVDELLKKMRNYKVDGFNKTRDDILSKLTKRMTKLDKDTFALANKLGMV